MTGYEISKMLQEAVDGDAGAAVAMWRSIASGQESSAEALTWVKHVAGQIVSEVIDPRFDHASRRHDAAFNAIGLRGSLTKVRDNFSADLEVLDSLGGPLTREETFETLRQFGHFKDVKTAGDVKKALRKIDYRRKR